MKIHVWDKLSFFRIIISLKPHYPHKHYFLHRNHQTLVTTFVDKEQKKQWACSQKRRPVGPQRTIVRVQRVWLTTARLQQHQISRGLTKQKPEKRGSQFDRTSTSLALSTPTPFVAPHSVDAFRKKVDSYVKYIQSAGDVKETQVVLRGTVANHLKVKPAMSQKEMLECIKRVT